MTKTNISDALYAYALKYGVKEHPVLIKIRELNKTLPQGKMQITPDQASLIGLFAKLNNAQKYLEIGVFTGYSSLNMALSMGQDGKIFAIDNNQEILNIAQKFWQEASVNEKITPLCGDALNILDSLCTNEHIETFDIAFIDANKSDYMAYYEYCYKLVKPGGIIIIDNVFMNGAVLEDVPPNFIKKVHELNQYLTNDERVTISLLPIADGVTIAYKKEL